MSKSIGSVSFFLFIIVLVSLPRKCSHNLQHIEAIPFSYLSSDMLLKFFFTCDICFLEDLHSESILVIARTFVKFKFVPNIICEKR